MPSWPPDVGFIGHRQGLDMVLEKRKLYSCSESIPVVRSVSIYFTYWTIQTAHTLHIDNMT
jgi:hypothetical protein